MRLNMFNSWKGLGTLFGKNFEYQTAKVEQGTGKLYATYIREAKSKAVITKIIGQDPKAAPEAAIKALNNIGGEAVWQAIETGKPISYNPARAQLAPKPVEPPRDIEWRDGTNHRYRAQKRIVGEQEEVKTKKPRNFVAKHARTVNKAGPMRDKKNDYRRKPKHDKKPTGDE